MKQDEAIGVFDSGIGGLTVAREIARRNPSQSLVYLGDTARLPYGSKSPETIIRYAVQNVSFLAQNHLKAIVVACNTVSAVALPALRSITGVPVLGVIEPGARAAVRASASGRIGVIGQPGTIASGRYEAEILRLRPEAQVHSNPTPLLVPLAEEGWVNTQVSRLVLKQYLEPLLARGVDTIVLGCTHYPLFREEIDSLLAEDHHGEITLVDSAVTLAEELKTMLGESGSHKGDYRFYATDDPAKFMRVGRPFWGEDFPEVIHVDL